MKNTIIKSILSGLLLAIASYVYVMYGGIIGAIFFSFGLITIVDRKLDLYTGKVSTINFTKNLLIILIFNLISAYIFGFILSTLNSNIIEKCHSILYAKINRPYYIILISSIFCNVMIYLAVTTNSHLLTSLYVVIFLIAGFDHCIANASYQGIVLHNPFNIFNIVCILGNTIGGITCKKIKELLEKNKI